MEALGSPSISRAPMGGGGGGGGGACFPNTEN